MAKFRRKERAAWRGDPGIITIYNANRVILEGVERIIFCDSEKMILKNRFVLQIRGHHLCLSELGNDNIAVTGNIGSLIFGEEEE